MGQRPGGDGAQRRRAEGGSKLSDRCWRWQGDQEESECQAGLEVFTSVYSVSIRHLYAFDILLKLSREFIDLLQEIFPPLILQDQDCFAGEAGAEELLALLPASAQIESLRKKWTADPDRSSEEKWDDIRNQVKIHGKKTPSGVSSPFDAQRADVNLIRFHRDSSWPQWRTSSSNTPGLESTRRSRSTEITYSRHPFAYTQRRVGSVCPWIRQGLRNSIRLEYQQLDSC